MAVFCGGGVGTLSRNKGKTFERAVAKAWREAMGLTIEDVKRGWQSRLGGKEEADVMIKSMPGLHVECNHSVNPPLWAKYQQAHADMAPDQDAVVVLRRNGWPLKQSLVVMTRSALDSRFGTWLPPTRLSRLQGVRPAVLNFWDSIRRFDGGIRQRIDVDRPGWDTLSCISFDLFTTLLVEAKRAEEEDDE